MGQLITIQDKSASNPLFAGDAKSVLSKNFKISGQNNIKTSNKTAQPTYTSADGTGATKYIKAYNRKKVEAQYSSFANPTITVDVLFKYADKDITSRTIGGVVTSMLSLTDLMHLVMSPKTFYINESSLLGQLAAGSNPYYSTYGIPVVVTTWVITPNSNNNDVVVTLTFNETKDEYLTTV